MNHLLMRTIMVPLYILLYYTSSFSQSINDKPVIDTSAYNNWYKLIDATVKISSDGRFVAYKIENYPRSHQTVVVRSVQTTWERKFVDALSFDLFEINGKQKGMVLLPGDTLLILDPGSDKVERIPNVRYYGKTSLTGNLKMLEICMIDRTLILIDCLTGKRVVFSGIDKHQCIDHANKMIFSSGNHILLCDLENMRSDTVLTISSGPLEFKRVRAAPRSGKIILSFSLKKNGKEIQEFGMIEKNRKYQRLISDEMLGAGFSLSAGDFGLTANDSDMVFKVEQKREVERQEPPGLPLVIWSSQDDQLLKDPKKLDQTPEVSI
ncbi:MAG: hypothetical protein J7497_13710, partial [Chitinophagaceae bacterium]|nr:hypothetical protein [Chitinophagaceae bacterium]